MTSSRYQASQLIAIPDENYEADLARLVEDIQRAGENPMVASEMCIIFVSGDKA